MSSRSAIDGVTLSIDTGTDLLPGEPIVTTEGEYVRLNVGSDRSVLIWIAKTEVVRLIGALVDAAHMQRPPNQEAVAELPNAPDAPQEINPDEPPF